MKGVIYARYSSHAQREESIGQQIEECQAFADANGIEVIRTYTDEAVSGRTDKRTSFQRLMRDVEKHEFDCVIAYKSNRIARNMLNALQYEDRLAQHGVQTLYAKEEFGNTAAGRFALRTMMNVNQFYSENMAEDIRRGLRDSAEHGSVVARLPFGFRKGEDGKYAIDEDEAEIVREIYRRVLNREKQTDIIDSLNERGVRTKHGNLWGKSSLAKILQNEKYIGNFKYMDISISVPKILDEDLFNAVQIYLKNKPKPCGRTTEIGDYLLTGKAFCGECGGKLVGSAGTSKTGKVFHYYRCIDKCGLKALRKEDFERKVTEIASQLVLSDEVIGQLADEAMRYQAEMLKQEPSAILEKELEETKKALSNCVRAIEQGLTSETVLNRITELEAEQKQLEKKIAKAQMKRPTFTREEFIASLEEYRGGDCEDLDYQRLIIGSFVKKVIVFGDRYEFEFYSGIKGKESSYKVQLDPPYVNCTNSRIVFCGKIIRVIVQK